jgi:hypothetical protein
MQSHLIMARSFFGSLDIITLLFIFSSPPLPFSVYCKNASAPSPSSQDEEEGCEALLAEHSVCAVHVCRGHEYCVDIGTGGGHGR